MARPLPDLAEAARRGAIIQPLIEALGGWKPAERALEAAGVRIRWETLRDYVRGNSVAPDGIVAAIEALVDDKPRWLLAKQSRSEKWVIHLHNPPFAARFVDGEPTSIEWFSGKPDARRHGDLIRQASEFLAEQ